MMNDSVKYPAALNDFFERVNEIVKRNEEECNNKKIGDDLYIGYNSKYDLFILSSDCYNYSIPLTQEDIKNIFNFMIENFNKPYVEHMSKYDE